MVKGKRYIGFTEGGDPSFNFNWVKALENDQSIDGVVVITKRLNKEMFKPLLKHKGRIILHLSVTGYAGTVVEPNTPDVLVIYQTYMDLLAQGFPKEHVVLRIDPIIPTTIGLKRADKVLTQFAPVVSRVRISLIDMYPEVKRRFKVAGLRFPYGKEFQPPQEMINAANKLLMEWKQKYPNLSFESCAEEGLTAAEQIGCLSLRDYQILNIQAPETVSRGRQRATCQCLGTKKELLGGKIRCPNGCLYCYWKDEPNTVSQKKEDALLH